MVLNEFTNTIFLSEFDYAHKQQELLMLHRDISNLRQVMKNADGTPTKFWMELMRDWLEGEGLVAAKKTWYMLTELHPANISYELFLTFFPRFSSSVEATFGNGGGNTVCFTRFPVFE